MNTRKVHEQSETFHASRPGSFRHIACRILRAIQVSCNWRRQIDKPDVTDPVIGPGVTIIHKWKRRTKALESTKHRLSPRLSRHGCMLSSKRERHIGLMRFPVSFPFPLPFPSLGVRDFRRISLSREITDAIVVRVIIFALPAEQLRTSPLIGLNGIFRQV